MDTLAYQVPGAPEGCTAAYVFPMSAPLMNPDRHEAYAIEPWSLDGDEWGTCSRMIPHDGTTGVWVAMVWDSAWRGTLRCVRGADKSPPLVVGEPTSPFSNEVRSRWYGTTDTPRGEVPSSVPECGTPDPEPRLAYTPGELTDPEVLHFGEKKWALQAAAYGGDTDMLGGFAYGTRIGVARRLGRWSLAPAVEFNSTLAAPWQDAGVFSSYSGAAEVWAARSLDAKGRLRAQAAVGAGVSRFQRDDDPMRTHAELAATTPLVVGSLGLSYSIAYLQAEYLGPGTVLCGTDFCADMRNDLQLTVGLLLAG